jgi:4-amino-4-deoxy-L-arabinose transferase-like glycosyltransferase
MTSGAPEMALVNLRRRAGRGIDAFDCVCAAGILLSFILMSFAPAAPSRFGDLYFHVEAQDLAHAVRGTGSWSEVTFIRAPAPVVYYAVPYLFVPGGSPDKTYWQAAVVWNAFWMLIAVLLVRRATTLLANAAAGKIAALLCLLAPFAVYYSFGVAAEAPAYVAATVFAYGWALWRTSDTARLYSRGTLIAWIGLVALILCRPNAVVVLGIAAVCAYVEWFYRAQHERNHARFAVVCTLVVLAGVSLITISFKRLPSNRGLNEQAANFSDVLFFGSFQFRSEPWDWRFWGKSTRSGSVDYQNWVDARQALAEESARSGQTISSLETKWTLSDGLHHPVKRLQMFGVRVLALNVWIANSATPDGFRVGWFRGRWAYFLAHVFLNGFALLPLFASLCFLVWNRARFFSFWPLWGIWVGLLLFHALTYAEPRYMLPALPGLAIMGGCALGARRGPVVQQ